MASISFRNRILLALVLLGAAPTTLGILGLAESLRRSTAVAGSGTMEELGTSGRALLASIDTTQLGPTERSALQIHLRQLNRALSLARSAVPYSQARTVALVATVLLLGALLLWASLLVARNLSRQLSRPIDELVGWTVLIRRGTPLPEEAPRKGAPEFRSLRIALKETSRELQQGRAVELEAERLRAFREVARRVAHEMKNPLTPVRFAVSQLSKTATPEQQEALEVLRTESGRLELLAREFANLGRLPEGPAADVDLGELLEELLRSSLPPEMESSLSLASHTPHILGHYDPLRRAFANLIRNAVEACGGVGRLDVSVGTRGDSVEVSLADHGPGIPDAERGRVFEPYFTRKPDGTGLGLAMVKQAVDLHGGTIELTETAGGGATFVIGLPIHRAELLPARTSVREGGPVDFEGQLAPYRSSYLSPDGELLPDRRATDRRRGEPHSPPLTPDS
ncbi:MAG: HAMP domain-containing sensor histidine kinase [Gemmatimonadota bacterium]|nr:HAMP domain-containing sensor histidine kinase [Gemmatimonadota bacterium]